MKVPMNRMALVGELAVISHGTKSLKIGEIIGGGPVNATVRLLETRHPNHVVRRPWEKVRVLLRKPEIQQNTRAIWLRRVFRKISNFLSSF